jgi:hypothetical protein
MYNLTGLCEMFIMATGGQFVRLFYFSLYRRGMMFFLLFRDCQIVSCATARNTQLGLPVARLLRLVLALRHVS